MGDARQSPHSKWPIGIGLFCAALAFEVGSALAMTWIANQTNTRGLGGAVLLLWIAGLVLLGRRFHHCFSRIVLICILCGSVMVAVPIYTFLGYTLFNWIGLNKP